MSMTREEAIEVLENGGWWDLLIPVTTIEGRIEDDKLHEALDLALTDLRPVSREQVEKVFPGCALCNWGGLDFVGVDEDGIYLSKPTENEKFRFCPACGRPLTDEAVQTVMERLEVLKDGKGD